MEHLWWVELQDAVDACGHARQNDSSIAFETLRPTVNEGDDGTGVQNAILIAQERYL